MDKHRSRLRLVAMHWLKAYKGKWIPANKTQNLVRIHEKYRGKIPAVEYKGMFIGVTDLTFVRWQVIGRKNQAETPFTEEGRDLYFQRTRKKRQNDRLDSMYNPCSMKQISRDRWGKHLDFEFYMNRAYALNRDRLKCRVCGGWLIACTPYAHRIDPYLPQNKVNKVGNLASMHKECMDAVNNLNADLSRFDSKARRKIAAFREKLDNSHAKTVAKMERRVR